MAHILKLTDGTTTVDFLAASGDPKCGLDDAGLTIHFPEKDQKWGGASLLHRGLVLKKHAYNNRKIDIRFEIIATTWTKILDQMTTIKRLLDNARIYTMTKLAKKVYLEYKLDGGSTSVYFDVVDGALQIPADLMSVEKLNWEKDGGNSLKGLELRLETRPFARGPEQTVVSSTQVHNTYDDNPYYNYVDITDGSTILGDVPGPARIVQHNQSTDTYNALWVGARSYGTLGSAMTMVLEAEDADTIYGTKTTESNADASGGQYIDWTSIATTSETNLAKWIINIDSHTAIEFGGRVRIFAVSPIAFTTGVRYRIQTKFFVTPLETMQQVRPATGTHIMDMGVLNLMPWGIEPTDQGWDYDLYFTSQGDTQPYSPILDALILLPADDYSYRSYNFMGYGLQNGYYLEDRGMEDAVVFRTAVYKSTLVDFDGLPIHLKPGQPTRIYFLRKDDTGDYSRDYNTHVTVYHTPYYLDVRGSS